jgi:hypothetical protein
MSDNDVNDLNSDGQECSSCDGGGGDGADKPCCGSGNSHKQQDLKTLIFVLVLILAGAVAAHSIMKKDKGESGCCPVSGQVEEGVANDDAVAGGCTGGKTEEAK